MSKTDRIQSNGAEVAQGYDALNFTNGLDVSEAQGVVSVGLSENGLTLTNTTTDNTISVDQNGNVGTAVATDGAVHIENTGNTGIGLAVYTNIGATADAPLVHIKADNAAFDQNVVYIQNDGVSNGLYLEQTGVLGVAKRALYIDILSDLSSAQAGGAIVYSNIANTIGTNSLMQVWADNPSSVCQVLNINQDGSGTGIYVDLDGTGAAILLDSGANGPHLRLVGDPTVASPTDGDMWYTGTALLFRDGATTRTISWV